MSLFRPSSGLVLGVILVLLAPGWADADTGFWPTWSDGKAELNGYRLTTPRYGELRTGYAVLVYVTEPFSRKRRVKVDAHDPANSDHFVALKLNRIQRFQTGFYDYAVMTSVFVDPMKNFQPVKVTFTAQEWCGQVFEESRFDASKTVVETRSYFDGETTEIALPGGVMAEDALFILARGLATGGPLAHGDQNIKLLGAADRRRLRHQPTRVFSTRLEWDNPIWVKVPAGVFEVRRMHWRRQDDVKCAIDVATQSPWPVVGWHCDDGERAELTGTIRSDYWRRIREGDERMLKALGLSVSTKR